MFQAFKCFCFYEACTESTPYTTETTFTLCKNNPQNLFVWNRFSAINVGWFLVQWQLLPGPGYDYNKCFVCCIFELEFSRIQAV